MDPARPGLVWSNLVIHKETGRAYYNHHRSPKRVRSLVRSLHDQTEYWPISDQENDDDQAPLLTRKGAITLHPSGSSHWHLVRDDRVLAINFHASPAHLLSNHVVVVVGEKKKKQKWCKYHNIMFPIYIFIQPRLLFLIHDSVLTLNFVSEIRKCIPWDTSLLNR